jgi:hypothetical protein
VLLVSLSSTAFAYMMHTRTYISIGFYMLSGLMRSCSNTVHSRFVLVGSAWYIVLIFSVAIFCFCMFSLCLFPSVACVSGLFILDCHFGVL